MNTRVVAKVSFAFLVSAGLMSCLPPEEPGPDGGVPLADVEPGGQDVIPPGENCGDGVINPGEGCDDGEAANGNGPNQCRDNCQRPVCGDGILDDLAPYEEACDDGNNVQGDGCNPNCVIEIPVALEVNLSGQVQNREYINGNYQGGTVVRVVNANCPPDGVGACISDASIDGTGNYTLASLPTNSALLVETRYAGETYGPQNTPVPGGYATRSSAQTLDQAEQTLNPYLLRYNAAAQIGVDCGVYADLDTALGNPDFQIYSMIFGKLEDAAGNGVAGINKNRLEVQIGAEINNSVTRANDTYFCWLGPDAGNPQKLAGTQNVTSQAGGYFMIFKARGDGGTGSGTNYVRTTFEAGGTNFLEKSVSLNAGNVGVVTLVADDNVVPPVELVSFNDVYDELYNGCRACHTEGGPGDRQDGGDYYARFDVAAQDVYNNLVGYGTNCAEGPRRVCVDNPEASLLLSKPLQEDPPNHPNATYADVNAPGYVLLKAWIEQGAVFQFDPPPPEPTLEAVITTMENSGCKTCHDGSAPRGGLTIGACFAPEIFDYAAVGIETDPAINPNYAQDCTHYHLTAETVLDDPYGGDYRVNVANPDQSMLLYNPFCGPIACVDPAESHPVQVFPNAEDPRYVLIRNWIAAGALNDYNPE